MSDVLTPHINQQSWEAGKNAARRSIVGGGATPARKVIGVRPLGQFQGLLQSAVEILFDILALHPPTQEIGPEKFAEGGRILGVSTCKPEFAGQTTERIVDEVGDSFRNIRVITSAALIVEWMHPTAVVEHHPKGVLFQLAQVRHDRDEYVLDAFFVQREGKMVMINDIMALLRSKNYGDHVLAQEFGALGVAFLTPALSFDLHLPHADRDLCRPKFHDWDRVEKRLTYVGHCHLPISCKAFRKFQSQPTVARRRAPSLN